MSRREEVLLAVVARLESGILAGVTVHRHAMRPLDKDNLPALLVYTLDVKPAPQGGTRQGLRTYEMDLRIEARNRGKIPDQVLDPLISHTQRAMLCHPLPDVILTCTEGETQFDALEGEHAFCAAALDYHLTFLDDPTAQGSDPWNTTQGGNLHEVTP